MPSGKRAAKSWSILSDSLPAATTTHKEWWMLVHIKAAGCLQNGGKQQHGRPVMVDLACCMVGSAVSSPDGGQSHQKATVCVPRAYSLTLFTFATMATQSRRSCCGCCAVLRGGAALGDSLSALCPALHTEQRLSGQQPCILRYS